MFKTAIAVISLTAMATGPSLAEEAAFPHRPITFVVAAPAGSTPDVGARAVAQAMGQTLKQPIVIENKPGANGLLAVQEVMRSPEDGYTLLVGSGSTMAINPHVYVSQSAGMLSQLTAVGKIYSTDFYLVVRGDSGIDSVRTLVSKAKAKPGALVAANGGAGSASQLAVEVLKEQAGIDLYQVPFNGSPAAALAVAQGTADVLIESLAVTQPFVDSGRMKRLAVTGPRRSTAFPNVPTMAEAGVQGMEVTSWAGLFARSKVPAARVNVFNAALTQALAKPEIQTLLRTSGLVPGGESADEFQMQWQTQSARWAQVVSRIPGLKSN